MKIGFAVMRLQPFTNGHAFVINHMLSETDRCYLIIGSANTFDERNPYPYEDRCQMVRLVYPNEIKSGKLHILPANDIHNPPKWASYIQSLLPEKPTHYYCGQGQDAHLFQTAGFQVREIERDSGEPEVGVIGPKSISATGVRNKMANGDNSWKREVPSVLIDYLLNSRRQHDQK